jgi:hypothetical protein
MTRHADDNAAVAALQVVMENADVEHFEALADIIPRMCDQNRSQDSSLVVFGWVHTHLTTVLRHVPNVDFLVDASATVYDEFVYLFGGNSRVPVILAGHGAIETVIMKAAAECLRENRVPNFRVSLDEQCREAFRRGYAKSAAAGFVFPASTHRLTALLVLGKNLHVNNYNPPKFEKVAANAKIICSLIGVDFRSLVSEALERRGGQEAWFQLGVAYTAALEYFATNPDLNTGRSIVESKWDIDSSMVPFLRVATSCFKRGGQGFKLTGMPSREEMLACSTGDNSVHHCVAVAHKIRDLAASSNSDANS